MCLGFKRYHWLFYTLQMYCQFLYFIYYRQIFFKVNAFKNVNTHFFANFLDCFWKILCVSRDFLVKVTKRKEKKKVSIHPFLETVCKVCKNVNTLSVKSLSLKKIACTLISRCRKDKDLGCLSLSVP